MRRGRICCLGDSSSSITTCPGYVVFHYKMERTASLTKATGSDGIPANVLKAWCSTASTTTLATLQLLGPWTHLPGQAGRYHLPLIQEQRRSGRLQHSLRSLARLQTLNLAPIQVQCGFRATMDTISLYQLQEGCRESGCHSAPH